MFFFFLDHALDPVFLLGYEYLIAISINDVNVSK